ncbi:MAG: hypothetical protein E7115_00360 [Bacteroidales bacterium]|nr:hypothetical protein [Bacteroidales bacterium]
MALNLFRRKKERKPSIRKKAVFSLGSLALIFVLSGAITFLEYRRMSDYVSERISASINSITLSQQLSDITEEYNNKMLAVVLRNDISIMPDTDEHNVFMAQSEVLKNSIGSEEALPILNKIEASFDRFISTSKEFDQVFLADTVDTHEWFFGTLQPAYNQFCHDMSELNAAIHSELQANSINFDESFYRSIVPGIVCICAGLLLVLLLMYFTIANYVNPIYRIAAGLNAYKSSGKRYANIMEGNDHLADINADVSEIIEENIELKHRVKNLKEDK